MNVLAGEYPGGADTAVARANLAVLIDAGIGTIIDLTEVSDGLRDYEPLLRTLPQGRFIQRLRAPIEDVGIAEPTYIHRILDIIDASLQAGVGVYIHCMGGIGRTGMIAGCLLVRRHMPPAGVLQIVESGWQSCPKSKAPRHAGRTSPETEAQKAVVLGWEEQEIERARARGQQRLRVIDINAPAPPAPAMPVDLRAHRQSRARGCLLGGAIGDALGWPVEFMSLSQIRAKHGPEGITELVIDPRLGKAAVTDDTQMTLFTAEGVLRGIARGNDRGIGGPESTMSQAYRRWFLTQTGFAGFAPVNHGELQLLLGETLAAHGPLSGRVPEDTNDGHGIDRSGWLIRDAALHVQRAPGTTCMSALRNFEYGSSSPAKNDSKGCGGVMRVAPIGLIHDASVESVFDLACFAAGITHGHPTGILSAGVFAAMVRCLLDGASIEEAVDQARGILKTRPEHRETSGAITKAVRAARSNRESSPELLATLGQGWVAEEALAIAIFCAMRGERGLGFEGSVRLAVNHDGDSDSTGSMTGQLLGAEFGIGQVRARWVEGVELREVVETVADDLVTTYRDDAAWRVRYPGF